MSTRPDVQVRHDDQRHAGRVRIRPGERSVGRHGGRRATRPIRRPHARGGPGRCPALTGRGRRRQPRRRVAQCRHAVARPPGRLGADHRGRSQEHRPLRRGARGCARRRSRALRRRRPRASPDRRGIRRTHVPRAAHRRRHARYDVVVEASSRAAGLRRAIRSLARGGVCTAVGYYLATGTRVPLMHMYATDATLRVGVSHARAVLPDLLAFVARTSYPAEQVTTLTAPIGTTHPPRTRHERRNSSSSATPSEARKHVSSEGRWRGR